jgi:hypothetical protein
VTDKATRLAPEKVHAMARARRHIENTGSHQWTTRWKLAQSAATTPMASAAALDRIQAAE